MDGRQALGVMAMWAAYFPQAALRDPSIELWASELLEFEQELAIEAVRILARSSRFVPSLAELREGCLQETARMAEIEWQKRREREGLVLDRGRARTPIEQTKINRRGVARARKLLQRVGRDMEAS